MFPYSKRPKWNKLKDLPKFIIAPGNHELSDGNDGDDIKLITDSNEAKVVFIAVFK